VESLGLFFYYIVIAIPSILFVGIVAHIKRRDVFGWVIISIISVAPIVLVVLLFMPAVTHNRPDYASDNASLKFEGKRDVDSKEYLFFLTKKYKINSETGSTRFKVNGKTFEKIDDAINYAHLNEIGIENSKSASMPILDEKADASGYWILFVLICFFVLLVVMIVT
jgi:hypothetical protein